MYAFGHFEFKILVFGSTLIISSYFFASLSKLLIYASDFHIKSMSNWRILLKVVVSGNDRIFANEYASVLAYDFVLSGD